MSTLNSIPQNEVVSCYPVIQQTVKDCAVACIAMLFGRSYAEVFQAGGATVKAVRKLGAAEKALRRLAKGVGGTLIRRNEFDIEEDTGILWLGSTDPKNGGHSAMLFRGVLIDPGTGQLWNPEVFMQTHHYIPEALFELG